MCSRLSRYLAPSLVGLGALLAAGNWYLGPETHQELGDRAVFSRVHGTRTLEGLNHLFQTARTGAIGEYADIPETMSQVVLRIVTEWLETWFKRNRTSVR